jgi:hypothetical protein
MYRAGLLRFRELGPAPAALNANVDQAFHRDDLAIEIIERR